ncbi:molybdopterin-dependent oxidoreductase [uncultured Microbacterium sp.]|uniref:molybdopterin-dependent oxidoreductase n=1 Tax=uncultured Microbacterium sp. TaxID=191216 RepID=UPI0035CABA72
MGPVTRAWRGLDGAVAGVAAVIFGAGIGELAAAILSPGSSPFAAIGSALIDFAPPWAKDTAIDLFGTNDKAALLVGIAIVLLVVAAGAGILERRLPPWGRVVFLLVGAAGAVAAMTRADSGLLSWIPSVIAGIGASVALWMLVRRAPGAQAPAQTARDDPGVDRRRFLLWSGGAVAIGVFATIGGATLRAGARSVEAIRAKITLPSPVATAPPIPASADLGIPGVASVITPNAGFYRIDTALIVPQIDPADWSLKVTGMVENEFTLTWDELLALPLEESVTTLTCVSNEVGGELIGNALWLGYPIRELLARARPKAGADMVLSRSIDGFTASSPLEALTDDRNAILAVGMNGDLLPAEHGFPVRMVVPGLYGYVSATKWVVELQVMRFGDAAAYWTQRGWAERGPIKLESRIDVPRQAQGLKAGDTVIAGVAWQQHVGVSGVEVQIDEGDWVAATLATAISDDTWVQWSMPWTASAGDHVLRCRAISATGEVQTGTHADVVPDGATGWHERRITVSA